jgi:hypothetical protein
MFAPVPSPQRNGDCCHQIKASGLAVLNSPLLKKATAFTSEERKTIGLTGLLPPVISIMDISVKWACSQYEQLPDALNKNVYLPVSTTAKRCCSTQ